MNAKTIDGFAFSRNGSKLELEFGLLAFDRVSDLLAQSDGAVSPPVRASVAGLCDSEGRSYLDVAVAGSFPMVCQRCLNVVEIPLLFERRLQLVRSESDLSDEVLENDGLDYVVSGREMSVKELVEDEVLLALPMVAMHDDCTAPDSLGD